MSIPKALAGLSLPGNRNEFAGSTSAGVWHVACNFTRDISEEAPFGEGVTASFLSRHLELVGQMTDSPDG